MGLSLGGLTEVVLMVIFCGDRAGADLLGPLLPAVAEICSDLEPTHEVEPSLLKLLRNLWFYIVMFGLAPPIQKGQPITLPRSMSSGSQGTISIMQTVGGPYMWNLDWSTAVHRLTQFTPPLVKHLSPIETCL
jgi:phosphatidylinositol 4-kinase